MNPDSLTDMDFDFDAFDQTHSSRPSLIAHPTDDEPPAIPEPPVKKTWRRGRKPKWMKEQEELQRLQREHLEGQIDFNGMTLKNAGAKEMEDGTDYIGMIEDMDPLTIDQL